MRKRTYLEELGALVTEAAMYLPYADLNEQIICLQELKSKIRIRVIDEEPEPEPPMQLIEWKCIMLAGDRCRMIERPDGCLLLVSIEEALPMRVLLLRPQCAF